MQEIIQNLFVGGDSDCLRANHNIPTIHACKTCHQKALGY